MQIEFKFLVRQQYDDHYFIQKHSHPCYELVYYLSGRGIVTIAGEKYTFSQNTCTMSIPNEPHSEYSKSSSLVIFIGFSIEKSIKNEPIPALSFFPDSDGTILQKLLEIEREIRNKKTYYRAVVNILTENLVYLLLRKENSSTDSRSSLDFKYILNYVESVATQRIPAVQIANHLGYNYDYLRQLFFSKTGMTLKNYIMSLRLNCVQKYLLNSKYTLAEIACVTGFASASHLCATFKKKFGISPSDFASKELQNPKTDNLRQAISH